MGIKCPKCHFENPDDTLYCGKCATPLPPPEEILASPTKTLETPVKELTRGTTFAGRYEFIEELGKGGMGRVYKVFDKKIKEEVAVKILKPEIASDETTIERFSNELKLARKIIHKNVGRMYELMEDEGTHYITMEYVAGEDLKSFIRRAGQLTVDKAVSITRQVCEGLAEAHKLGVVHRDLKPGNIMIDKEGNARIMDFGIARSLKGEGITTEGVVVGTPEYMSPEQVDGKEADHRSDIYSLGIILYEMLTGRVPFEGDTSFSVALKHKTEMPKDPCELNAQIPESISHLILRCMQKKREDRYQSVKEILDELKHIKAEKAGIRKKVKLSKLLSFLKWRKTKKPSRVKNKILRYSLRVLEFLLIFYGIISLVGLANDAIYRGKIEKIQVEHDTFYKNFFPVQKDWLPEEWDTWNCNSCNGYKKIFPYTLDDEGNRIVEGEYQKTDYVKEFMGNPDIEKFNKIINLEYENIQDLKNFLEDYSMYFKLNDFFEAIKCTSLNPLQMIKNDQRFNSTFVIRYTRLITLLARVDFLEGNYEQGFIKIRNAMTFILDLSISSHSLIEFMIAAAGFRILCMELIPAFLSDEVDCNDTNIKKIEKLILLIQEELKPESIFYKEYLYIGNFYSFWMKYVSYYIYEKLIYFRDGFSVYRSVYKGTEFYKDLLEGLKYIRNIRDKSVYMKDYYEKNAPKLHLLLPNLSTNPFRFNLARVFGKLVLVTLYSKKYGLDSHEFSEFKGTDVFINELSGKKFEIISEGEDVYIVLDENYKLNIKQIDYGKGYKQILQSFRYFNLESMKQLSLMFYSFEME